MPISKFKVQSAKCKIVLSLVAFFLILLTSHLSLITVSADWNTDLTAPCVNNTGCATVGVTANSATDSVTTDITVTVYCDDTQTGNSGCNSVSVDSSSRGNPPDAPQSYACNNQSTCSHTFYFNSSSTQVTFYFTGVDGAGNHASGSTIYYPPTTPTPTPTPTPIIVSVSTPTPTPTPPPNSTPTPTPPPNSTPTPTPTPAPPGSPLTASCSVNPTFAATGQSVLWSAFPSGGSGSYSYSWSGTDGLSGFSQSVNRSYSTTGTKTGLVFVSDTAGGGTGWVSCSNSVSVTTTAPTPTPPPASSPPGSFSVNATPSTGCSGTTPTITVSWGSSANAASYDIWRFQFGGDGLWHYQTSVFTPQTTFVDTNVSSGSSYLYSVTAVNSFGQTQSSNQTNSVTAPNCAAPTPTPALPTCTVSGSWTFCSGEGGTCSFSGGATTVRYGYGPTNQWTCQVLNSPVGCNSTTFGDPSVGNSKECDYIPTGSAPTPTPTSIQPHIQTSGGDVHSNTDINTGGQ